MIIMITHVVLFKLKDNGAQNIDSTRKLLESMEGKISGLRYLEVGTNLRSSERAYDISLIAKFDTLKDLEAYDDHPIHVPVSNRMQELSSSIVVVDYQSK